MVTDNYRLQLLLKSVWQYTLEETQYTTAIRSTPIGQQSDDIRWRAKVQKDSGQIEASCRLYEEALRLHGADDDSAAAAGARHDLAETLTDRHLGLHVENLLRAQVLYRRAQRSTERERNPSRSAMTRASLASCLRGLAGMPMVDAKHERKLLDEAQELLREAIRIDERRGPAGLPAVIEHLNTLANLYGQRDQLDAAARAIHRIEDKYVQLAQIKRELEQSLQLPLPPALHAAVMMVIHLYSQHEQQKPLILLNAAKLYLQRGRAGRPMERARAMRLLESLVADSSLEWADRARLCLAEALLDDGSIEQARAHLDQIKEDHLHHSLLTDFADAYARAGLPTAALIMLHKIIDRSILERRNAETDHASDTLALRAQAAANQAAVILTDRGDAVSAFLALENVSGMRFEEHILTYSFRPRSQLGFRLWTSHRSYAHAAAILFRVASQSVYVSEEHRADYWRDMVERFQRKGKADIPGVPGQTEEEQRVWRQFVSETREWTYTDNDSESVNADDLVNRHLPAALTAADPTAEILRRAQSLVPAAVALKQAVADMEGERFADYARGQTLMANTALHGLLVKHSDYVFVRLTVTRDTLVVASVFLEDGSLVGRALRLVLPQGLYDQLELVREHPKRANMAQLTEALASLDISPVLPSGHIRRIVLLPSWFASFLPLGAIGPKGRMPVDLCDGLLWLPCLAPLRCPQAPLPPRQGLLAVTPVVTPNDGGTHLHDSALAQPLPNEERLRAGDASLLAVASRATKVRAVCFYTHGCHESEALSGPHLALADGRLHRGYLDGRWLGMERVELWACQSGVSLPHDPLTPRGVTEGFGLDVEFLKVGVRSTIGTLWPVWEVVTACILWRYRAMLSAGLDAPAALSAAQRFWRDTGLGVLLQELAGQGTPAQRMQRFWDALGIPAQRVDADAVMSSLGATDQTATLQSVREKFGSPTAWGGFRFMGCPESFAAEPWDDSHLQSLGTEDQQKLDQILQQINELEQQTPVANAEILEEDETDEPGDAALNKSLSHALAYDEQVEARLVKAIERQKDEHVSAEQAIRVARLYRDRVQSSHAYNLLLGLAWLHEALANPVVAEPQRDRLRVEAAHLWLDVAQGEAVTALDYYFGLANPVGLERAKRLLLAMSDAACTFDRQAAQARLLVLQDLGLRKESLEPELRLIPRAAVEQAWQSLSSYLVAPLTQTHENQRALTAVCELLALAPEVVPAGCEQVLALAQSLLKVACLREEWPSLLRLAAASIWLADRCNKDIRPMTLQHISILTAPEAARMTAVSLRSLFDEGWFAAESGKVVISHVMSRLEAAFWGAPSGDRQEIWHTIGNSGAAYRHVVSGFLGGHPDQPPVHQHASHLLGSVHLLCDLRLKILNRTVRAHRSFIEGRDDGVSREPPLWMDAYHREQVLITLTDAALLRQLDEQFAISPHALDPYVFPVEQFGAAAMEHNGGGADCLTAFELERACAKVVFHEPENARTAAFRAARIVERMTQILDEQYMHVLATEREIAKKSSHDPQLSEPEEQKSISKWLFDPELLIKYWEERLRQLNPGEAVLGLCLGSAEKLVAMVCWRTERGPDQKVVHSAPGLAFRVRAALIRLLRPQAEDLDGRRGRAGDRGAALEFLQESLAPLLQQVLEPILAVPEPFDLAILAPGHLRALPLFSLRAGKDLLAERFNSLRHLPTLGWWSSEAEPSEKPWTTCLLSRCAPRDGETCFGEAAIRTLRAAFYPQCVVDPNDVSTRRIIEVDRIEETAERVECLRLYGVGAGHTINHATSAMTVEGNCRLIGVHNIYKPLARCETVELWAATAGAASMMEITHERPDHIPGLAYHYLACGAANVLDLAWPVFDLTKALVCERYGLLRRCGFSDCASALAEAVAQVRELLREWKQRVGSFADVKTALAYLDERRRHALVSLGLDAKQVIPFASRSDTPSIAGMSVPVLISEASQLVHLSAFRFWGGL